METSIKNNSSIKHHNSSKKSHVADATNGLLREGKKLVHELYDEGLNKVSEVEDSVQDYSEELLDKVKKNPLSAVLIAAGVGFLLSSIFKK